MQERDERKRRRTLEGYLECHLSTKIDHFLHQQQLGHHFLQAGLMPHLNDPAVCPKTTFVRSNTVHFV